MREPDGNVHLHRTEQEWNAGSKLSEATAVGLRLTQTVLANTPQSNKGIKQGLPVTHQS